MCSLYYSYLVFDLGSVAGYCTEIRLVYHLTAEMTTDAPQQRWLKCTLEYDGTNYKGFQIQPGQRTIQEEVESALFRLTGTFLCFLFFFTCC